MSPLSVPRLVISSPDTFVAAVPHLLGFTPANSVVIAGIGQVAGRDEITLVQRFDIPSPDTTPEDLLQIARSAAAPMARTGAHEVIIAVVSDNAVASPDDLPQRELVDLLVESHDDAGMFTRDSLYTDGTSRWSYGCFDPACCPPAGRVIPDAVRTHVAAEFTAAGVAVRGSRAELAAELAPADPARVHAVSGHLEALPDTSAGIERWRDQAIQQFHQDVSTGASIDDASCARVIAGLDDVRVRDTVLWDLAQGRGAGRNVIAALGQVVRTSPEARCAPAATVLSIQHWTAGDGARANVALDRALGTDPNYSLGGLVQASLRSGLPPATWRDLMRTMPRDTCRHGNNPPVAEPLIEAVPVALPSPGLAAS
jgi:hypothetical protein